MEWGDYLPCVRFSILTIIFDRETLRYGFTRLLYRICKLGVAQGKTHANFILTIKPILYFKVLFGVLVCNWLTLKGFPIVTKIFLLQHRCYIVATCDKDLKRRIRKIPVYQSWLLADESECSLVQLVSPEICILLQIYHHMNSIWKIGSESS